MKPFYRVLTYLALVIQSMIILCLLAERKVSTNAPEAAVCHRQRSVPQTGNCLQWNARLPVSGPELLISALRHAAP